MKSYQGWPKLLFAVYERDAQRWWILDLSGTAWCAALSSLGAHGRTSACVFVANDRTRARRRARATTSPRRAPSSRAGARRCCAARRCTPRRWSPRGWERFTQKIAVLSKNLDISGLHVKPVPRGDRRAGGRSSARRAGTARGPLALAGPPERRGHAPGLDSVRRRFTADAAAGASPARSGIGRIRRRGRLWRASRAPRGGCLQHGGGAWPRVRPGEAAAPGGHLDGGETRVRSAGDATAALVSARRAEQERAGGVWRGPTTEAAPRASALRDSRRRRSRTSALAIEDAPLASGRDARVRCAKPGCLRAKVRRIRTRAGGARGDRESKCATSRSLV